MYAVLGHSELDPSRSDEAVAWLENQLIPGLQNAPGFVSATFVRTDDRTTGRSMVVFQTREQAETLAASAPDRIPADGPVKLISIEVNEVTAQG